MHPNAPDSPIRVALLLDSLQQPRWFSTMVQEILALPYAERQGHRMFHADQRIRYRRGACVYSTA
jgi:hypothetical protein